MVEYMSYRFYLGSLHGLLNQICSLPNTVMFV